MVGYEDGVEISRQHFVRNPDGVKGVAGIVFLLFFIDVLGLKLLPADHKYAGMWKFV